MLDKIRQIKYSRLKEEEKFFFDTIGGVEPFTSDKYPNSIFWMKDDRVYFEHDFGEKWFLISIKLVWCVFKDKFGYEYSMTQSFVKDMMKRHNDIEMFNKMSTFGYKFNSLNYDINEIKTFIPLPDSKTILSDKEGYKKLGIFSKISC